MENNNQKSVVQFLEEELTGYLDISHIYKKELFNKVKEMQKELIIKTYDIAVHDTLNFDIDRKSSLHFAKRYYNENFKSE